MKTNLLKDSLIYGMASSIQKLVPFFLIPIITNYLGKEALKIYDVAFVYASLFSWFIILGQDSAAGAFYFDKDKRVSEKALSYSFYIQLFSLVSGFGLLLIFQSPIASLLFQNDASIGHLWPIAIWIIPGHVLLSYALNLLQWDRRSMAYFLLCLINTAGSIALVVYYIVFKRDNLQTLFLIYICANTATALAATWLVRKKIFQNISPVQWQTVKRLLQFGFPFALFSFFHQLMPSIDRYFLLHYNLNEQLPIYSLAVKLGGGITLLTGAISMSFIPYTYRVWNNEGAEKKVSQMFKAIVALLFLTVPLLLVFKNIFISLFANDTYNEAANLLPFFFLGWVFELFSVFSMLGVYKSKSGTKAFGILFTATAITALLNVALIPLWGLYGAASAFLVSKILLFFVNLFFSQKDFRLHIAPRFFFTMLLLAGLLCYLSTVLNTAFYALVTFAFITATLLIIRFRHSNFLFSTFYQFSKA